MSEATEKRRALCNGHKAWLKLMSPPWHFVEGIGRAWEQVEKDPSATVLVDFITRQQNQELALQPNSQVCQDLKTYFEKNAIDPLLLGESGPWVWLARYLMALRVGSTWLNQEKLRGEDLLRDKAAGTTNANCWYSHFNAWLGGNQTFVFSLPLASKLLLTDATHVQWSDFHCPFRAFIIQLPPELACLIDPNTGDHPLDTIVVVDGYSQGRRRLQLLFKGQENENSKCLGDDATIYCNMWQVQEDDELELSVRYSQRDEDDQGGQARLAGMEGDAAVLQLMRFAVSCICYLTDFPEDRVAHINPEINRIQQKLPTLQGKPKQNAKAKLRSLLKEPVPYLVGTKVTIDPTLEKIAGAVGKGQALPPSVASYVRGHRKMQPHGPQRSLRKPIWVDPYWRNLESEVSSSKTYDVK